MTSIKQIIRKLIPAACGFIIAIVSLFAFDAAMKPVSKSEYCGWKCHEMNSAYQSWELSVHGSNPHGLQAQCIDCHLPPKDEHIRHFAQKAHDGIKDFFIHHFGGEYDQDATRRKVIEKMPDKRCLNCHSNLLSKPGSSAARMAHTTAINDPSLPAARCISCHESAGHQRHSNLFSE